uniref:Uncharacterized protein n=1 Tax=Panagrolaimus davidi TaxID=227884 RepID=A0A914Q2S2_9BILA
MAYLGSFSTTPIIPEFSCAGYGDILFIDAYGKSEKISEPIVQHNLAAFWQRPGLSPISAGFSIPLTHLAAASSKGVYSKPPGAWLFSTPKRKIFRRNLLSSELIDDASEPSGVRIFGVNESSDRKTLIESQFSFVNPLCEMNKIFKLSHSEESHILELPSEAYEVRTYQAENVKRKVFVRTKDSLLFCNMEDSTVNKCYAFPVCDFFQVPYLDENLVLIDSFQRLWHGSIERNFTRKKVNLLIQAAAATDCPKVIIGTDGEKIQFIDLRESRDSSSNDILYKLEDPAFFNSATGEFMETMTEVHQNKKEEIFHLSTLPQRPFATIASSNRHHILLDHRMPGQSIISMSHSNINGGDYCFAAPPMNDGIRKGAIYNFFSQNQTQYPQTSYWPVYLNTPNSIWSSIGPVKTLQIPSIIENYCLAKPGTYPKNFSFKQLPKYSRSICFQSLATAHSIGDTRAIIFQQMDSGDIWYNNFIIDPSIDKPINQKKFRTQTFRAIEKYFSTSEDSEYFRQSQTSKFADEIITQDLNTKIKCYKILPTFENLSSVKNMDISETLANFDPFAEIGRPLDDPPLKDDEIVIQEAATEDNIFSSIIIKSWAKSDIAFMNYLNGIIERDVDDEENVLPSVPSSPQSQQQQSQQPSTSLTPQINKLVPFEDEAEEDFNFDDMDFHSD